MFSTKGLFSEVICPYRDTCILPRCIFKHPDAHDSIDQSLPTEHDKVSLNHGQEGQRKRVKTSEGDENTTILTSSLNIEKSESNGKKENALPLNPPKPKTGSDEKPSKKSLNLAATREISPPPLRRTSQSKSSASIKHPQSSTHAITHVKPVVTTPKSVSKKPAKAPLKQEDLNPRHLKTLAPASHDMRYRLLRALHDQFVRLNTELSKDANDAEENLVLSEQELITRALDIEHDAAFTPTIYSNFVKNKILFYKRMTVKQWVEERRKEVAKEKALETAPPFSSTKSNEPPKVIETGLTLKEELTLLHRLSTPISGLSKYGYVTSIPTEKEIESARQGVTASGNWEVCDRCKSRFQVFPGRREDDGALASGGKCKYHFGKPYFPERNPSDPKAKREKKYRCCGESLGDSTGCVHAENHVFKITEVKRLAAVLNFEKTPENLDRVSEKPVCIDGEMGYTVYGLELIRLTATSWPTGEELFDVLVRPLGLILDLNSRYSGVWPKNMVEAQPYSASIPEEKDSAKRKLRIVESPAAARALLFSYLSPVTPLIGHGLENDLNAIRMIHPTIIDTALLFPHKAGLPYRNGLKTLMSTHLNRQIQVVVDGKMEGHDSKEDANAAGELVRFALANEWAKMKREGWVVKDGEFRPPTPKGVPGAPAGPKASMSVEYLEREQPIRILSKIGAGRKRTTAEFEADAEDGEVNG